MIHQSYFWKQDLLKQAQFLRRKVSQKRWPEAAYVRLEQAVMLGCYAVRKLAQSDKLTDGTSKSQMAVTAFPLAAGQEVTRVNRHRVEELYDLDKPRGEKRSIMWVCNQVIHSYVMIWLFDSAGGLHGFFVSSDLKKNSAVYQVPVSEIIEMFERVGNDKVKAKSSAYDPKKRDFDVSIR